jgi:hypothetical protein
MSQWGFEILRSSEVDDSNLVLRRYLTPPKFTGLTTSGSLYFAPASSFSDESEGHYTQRDYDAWDQELVHAGFDDRSRARASSAKAKIAYWNRQAVVISCWTAGASEDLRMWREYGKSSNAVAIETTVGALRASLGPDFLIIPVTYLDFGNHSIPKRHSLQPYFFKRSHFSWEREVRVIGNMEMGKRIGTPRFVPIDLQRVVNRLIISPFATSDYVGTIERALRAHSLSIPLVESEIVNAG